MGVVTIDVRVETVCARCSSITVRNETLYIKVGKLASAALSGECKVV